VRPAERSETVGGGLGLEGRAAERRSPRAGGPLERQERAEGEWMVRKGGLEPPRYCYRQPLNLGLTMIARDPCRPLLKMLGRT
jgi:hypothetical protein